MSDDCAPKQLVKGRQYAILEPAIFAAVLMPPCEDVPRWVRVSDFLLHSRDRFTYLGTARELEMEGNITDTDLVFDPTEKLLEKSGKEIQPGDRLFLNPENAQRLRPV